MRDLILNVLFCIFTLKISCGKILLKVDNSPQLKVLNWPNEVLDRTNTTVYQIMEPYVVSTKLRSRGLISKVTQEQKEIILSPCGKNFSSVNGIFTTPGWPLYYPHYVQDCHFHIHLPDNEHTIKITCDKFHLQPRSNGSCIDYLSINGNRYCGDENLDISLPSPLNISFVSDGVFRYPGAECVYRSIQENGIAVLNGFNKTTNYQSSNNYDRGSIKQFFHGRCQDEASSVDKTSQNVNQGIENKEETLKEGLWSGKCGDSPVELKNRIIGGYETEIHQYPWMVSIFKPCDDGGDTDEFCHVCGGTVISDTWILTAAHCINKLDKYNISIILGDHNLKTIGRDQRSVNVDRVIIHPDYNSPTFLNNDIGLLRTEKHIPFSNYVSPLCLPGLGETGFGTFISHNTSTLDTTGLMVVGKNATIIGWGVVSDDDDFPDGLNEVIVEVMDNKICKRIYGPGFTENMMCTSGKNGKGDCYGDSGGPALVKNEKGSYIQVGILSFGAFDGCELGYPSGQVFVFKFIDWIQHITGLQFGSN